MKKLALILLLLLIPTFAHSAVANITEEDGSPSVYPWKIKFANGTLTDNADGTVSHSQAGGGGSPGGSDTEVQYNNGGAFGGMSEVTYVDTAGSEQLIISGGTLPTGSVAPFKLVGTANASAASTQTLLDFQMTGSAHTSQQHAAFFQVLDGYTGSSTNTGVRVDNYSDGTGDNHWNRTANLGLHAAAYGIVATGTNIGVDGFANGGSTNIGTQGRSINLSQANDAAIGVVGLGQNDGAGGSQIGGYFGLDSTTATFTTSAALIADNDDETDPIFMARDNATSVVEIRDGGSLFIKEKADASADEAGWGQIWINTATPNELWFTDDAGTDTQLGVSGSGDITDVGSCSTGDCDLQTLTIGDGSSGNIVWTYDGDAGTDGSFKWDVTNDEFEFTNDVEISLSGAPTNAYPFNVITDIALSGTDRSINIAPATYDANEYGSRISLGSASGVGTGDIVSISSSGVGLVGNVADMLFETQLNSEKMRLKDDGEFIIGTSTGNYTDGEGDLLVSGELEVDGISQFETTVNINSGTLFIKETADAAADVAGYGQIWINTATPNELWFTDDAGTDVQLGVSGSGDVSGVGDCASGACLDGTSDGGTYIRLYDGDSNYTEINNGDANQSADLKWVLPNVNGTAGQVLEIASVATDTITLEWDDDGGGGSSVMDEIVLRPSTANIPASNPGAVDLGSTTHLIAYDASTDESNSWTNLRLNGYASGTVKMDFTYTMASATSGNVILCNQVWAQSDGDSADVDTESYSTANCSAATAVPGTAGYPDVITVTMSNLDSMADSDLLNVKIYRDADSGSDTATGDLELRLARLYEE